MVTNQNERTSKARVVWLGGREIITEGLHLNFWADISHPDIRSGTATPISSALRKTAGLE